MLRIFYWALMDYGSCVILEAPPPIISTLRSLKKWALKKTISESTVHLHIQLPRLNGKLFFGKLVLLVEKMLTPSFFLFLS